MYGVILLPDDGYDLVWSAVRKHEMIFIMAINVTLDLNIQNTHAVQYIYGNSIYYILPKKLKWKHFYVRIYMSHPISHRSFKIIYVVPKQYIFGNKGTSAEH